MNGLANAYLNGEGVEKNASEAFRWFLKSAELGEAQAQHNVSVCFKFGTGTPKDPIASLVWLKKGAESGFPESQASLGECYFYGNGVQSIFSIANEWFLKAANNGHSRSMWRLAQSHFNGFGFPKDQPVGLQWFRKALEAEGIEIPEEAKAHSPDSEYSKFCLLTAITYEGGIFGKQDLEEAARFREAAIRDRGARQ